MKLVKKLVEKSGVKMKALVAMQRKLLELIYVTYKNRTTFNGDYEQGKRAAKLKMMTAL